MKHYVIACALFCLLAESGCSRKATSSGSEPTAHKQKASLQRIQGRLSVTVDYGGEDEGGLQMGAPVAYLEEDHGPRYRLYLRSTTDLQPEHEYVVEGVNTQKIIDDLGDPDQGRNGYPLPSSCEQAVRLAWDDVSAAEATRHSEALRARLAKYPTTRIFLVTRMHQAQSSGASTTADTPKARVGTKVQRVSVDSVRQKELLVDAPQPEAPLWAPEGGTIRFKVIIGTEGRITSVEFLRPPTELAKAGADALFSLQVSADTPRRQSGGGGYPGRSTFSASPDDKQ